MAAILRRDASYRNHPSVVVLGGGVGGARLARGMQAEIGAALTVIVNVADDDVVYGVDLSPDLDTVLYTLAGIEGPHGWGIRDDSRATLDQLARLGENTTLALGDRDLATNLFRTARRRRGEPLSEITAALAAALGVAARVLPVSDDAVRTEVRTPDGTWLSFQQYFVHHAHSEEVVEVRFTGADTARPAPGVLASVAEAALVVIAPSNPPLSVWPMLAVPGLREALVARTQVAAVSPLIGGRALKGPADRVLASLGLPGGNAGVAAAYAGIVTDLVVDHGDAAEPVPPGVTVHAADTRIAEPEAAATLARRLLELE